MDFLQDSTISKLLMLFVMEKMEMPLTERSIIDICTSQNDWLNYMECKDVLFKLLEANFIYCIDNHGNEERYNITFDGKNCLEHFYHRIPVELRDQIIEYIKNNRLNLKKSQEFVADYFKNNDGTYLVVLKIRSHTINYPMFEIKIATSSRQSAIETCKNWRENAHIIYEQVYQILLENKLD